jgi:O-antigen/teichoic acid export membrane protein
MIAGALLGPAALGGLKAAQALVTGPSLVLIQAGGSVGLPEASRALAEQGAAGLRRVRRLVTIVAACSVGLIAVVVVVAGRPLLSAIYGPSFASLHTTAVLIALSVTISAVGLGPILALKALRVTRPLLSVQFIAVLVLIAAALALTGPFATNGTAMASVLSSIVLTVLLVRALSRAEGRRLALAPRALRIRPRRRRTWRA